KPFGTVDSPWWIRIQLAAARGCIFCAGDKVQRLRDLVVAVSLANLCFYAVWAELLPGSPSHYFLKAPPPPVAFAAVAVNIAVFAAGLWVGAQAFRRSTSRVVRHVARAALLATVAAAANGIRVKLPGLGVAALSASLGHTGVIAAAVGLGCVGLFVVLRLGEAAAGVAVTLVLLCAPFVLVTFGRAVWALIDYQASFST